MLRERHTSPKTSEDALAVVLGVDSSPQRLKADLFSLRYVRAKERV
jgi:hypothetical protein